MNEYQDQVTWYELYQYDMFKWVFVADFDSREDASEYALTNLDGEYVKIKRVSGLDES